MFKNRLATLFLNRISEVVQAIHTRTNFA